LIDLNCDAGEGFGIYNFGADELIFKYVTSVNIACGFHAGDPDTIKKTVDMAVKNNLSIGAHPSFPDLLGFGRREMNLSYDEIKNYVLYQIGALNAFVKISDHMTHVKPHGALYNMAFKDTKIARAIVDAVKAFDSNLIIVGLPKSALVMYALEEGLKVALEGFADRTYNDDGTLVSRNVKGAVLEDANEIAQRALHMVKEGVINTLCVHSDTPNAPMIVMKIRETFDRFGVEVKGLGN
jgi:UPF0271 protein